PRPIDPCFPAQRREIDEQRLAPGMTRVFARFVDGRVGIAGAAAPQQRARELKSAFGRVGPRAAARQAADRLSQFAYAWLVAPAGDLRRTVFELAAKGRQLAWRWPRAGHGRPHRGYRILVSLSVRGWLFGD